MVLLPHTHVQREGASMIPKPLNDPHNYMNALNLLEAMSLLKKHDIMFERNGEFFTVREFANLNGMPTEGSTEGHRGAQMVYNDAVRELCSTRDKAFLNTVYAMMRVISPVGLLRKRMFEEGTRVEKVDKDSSVGEMADCRVHLDLITNLYKAADANPLSAEGDTGSYADKALAAIDVMESMYREAADRSRAMVMLRGAKEDGSLRYNDIEIVEMVPKNGNKGDMLNNKRN